MRSSKSKKTRKPTKKRKLTAQEEADRWRIDFRRIAHNMNNRFQMRTAPPPEQHPEDGLPPAGGDVSPADFWRRRDNGSV